MCSNLLPLWFLCKHYFRGGGSWGRLPRDFRGAPRVGSESVLALRFLGMQRSGCAEGKGEAAKANVYRASSARTIPPSSMNCSKSLGFLK
jgi:hypothetical protein